MSNLNLSPVAQFIQSNFNKQTATLYKSNLDAGMAALSIISQQFAPHQTGTTITANGTGTGSTGTYTVNLSQTVGTSGSPVNFTTPEGNAFTGYISGATLTVTAVGSGFSLDVGDFIQGGSVILANMTVMVDAGNVMSNNTFTTHGVQTSATIAAPVGNPRIDRVVINAATGTISVVTGTPAASPTPPAIPFGCLPCCQVLLQPSTTAIVNSMITDERAIYTGAGGSSLTENTIATNQSLGAANTGNNYVCTAALTLTIAQTTTLPSTWYNTVNAQGGNVTLTPNAADKINGGTAGASMVVPKGFYAQMDTDAAGNLYVTLYPGAVGISTLASASTVDLGSAGYLSVNITGTTAITSFGTTAQIGEIYTVTFAGALTLTYNATSLILPGAANITTAANDSAQFLCLGGGNWKCIDYQTASGQSLVSSSGAIQGAFKNLKISTTGTSAVVSIAADAVALMNAAGNYFTVTNVSLAPSTGAASGAANSLDAGAWAYSTWYSVWLIYSPATQTLAALFSTSATAPALPSGYTYFARIGWLQTQSATSYYPLSIQQAGRNVQYKTVAGSNVPSPRAMASGVAGSAAASNPTWVAVGVSSFVPPTVATIRLLLPYGGAGAQYVAPNGNYNGYGSTTNSPPMLSFENSSAPYNILGEFVLESANIYWACNNAGGGLFCMGYTDNI